jgi:hypothetical protein
LWQDVQVVSPGAPVLPSGGPPLDALTTGTGRESNIVKIKKTTNDKSTANLTVCKLIFTFLSSDLITGGNDVLAEASEFLAKVVGAPVGVATEDDSMEVVVRGLYHGPNSLVREEKYCDQGQEQYDEPDIDDRGSRVALDRQDVLIADLFKIN